MSITDELREWFKDRLFMGNGYEEIRAIADRIDAEHERMCRSLTIDMEPMTDERMAEHGWVRLPVDADGVPIRVGDVVAATLAHGGSGRWSVDRMELTRAYDQDLWQIALDKDGACWVTPSTVRHHHATTVEDVLREFAERVCVGDHAVINGTYRGIEDADLLAEYAKRLRLAGEDE